MCPVQLYLAYAFQRSLELDDLLCFSASQLKIFLPNVYIIFTPCNGDGAGDGSGSGCVCPDPLEQQL